MVKIKPVDRRIHRIILSPAVNIFVRFAATVPVVNIMEFTGEYESIVESRIQLKCAFVVLLVARVVKDFSRGPYERICRTRVARNDLV